MEQQNEILARGLDMMYLVNCALHGRLADRQRLQKMDMSEIYQTARRHSMLPTVYIALEPCFAAYGDDIVVPALRSPWHYCYAKELKKLLSLEVERENLASFLQEKGIWYLFLKGAVLQNYYNRIGMRPMLDIDLLIDPDHADDVRDYMLQSGYQNSGYGVGHHDVYRKNDLCFEVHRSLVSPLSEDKLIRYYENVRDRLIPSTSGLEMHFTDEDFYIYFICHAYKHYTGSGYGVRFLVDAYVLLQALKEKLDLARIETELTALGMVEFEQTVRSLSQALLSPGIENPYVKLGRDEKNMLLNCLQAGTFGTYQTKVKNSFRRLSKGKQVGFATKLCYLWQRVFPPISYYRVTHPALSRWIVTIPLLWLYRVIKGCGHPRRLSEELRQVRKVK